MQPLERTRERGSSERGRPPPTARSVSTRTGRLPTTPARPEARPASECSQEGRRLRELGLEPSLFCGGGWYTDVDVAEACADLGYVDCTPRARRPPYLAPVRRGLHWPSRRASGSRRSACSRRFLRRTRSATSLARSFGRDRCHLWSTSTSTTPISRIAAAGSACAALLALLARLAEPADLASACE